MWMRGEQISDVSRRLRRGEAQFGVNVVKEVVRKKMKEIKKIKIGIAAATVFKPLVVTAAFAVLAIGIVGVSASGPTYVSGIISSNTTWTAAGSPYIVTGNILVKEGVTLTIEPGVVVKFDLGKAMQIDGELIARGTEAEPIIFTSNQFEPAPGDWVNILFTDTSVDAVFDESGNYISGCILQYCTVEYGGGSDTPALKIISSSLFIDQCTITQNAYTGISVDYGSLKITNSIISNNSGDDGGGIRIEYGTVIISNNIIRNNSANRGGGIDIMWGTGIISNNTIINNLASTEGDGIRICGEVNITKNTISNNSGSYEGGGVYITGVYLSTPEGEIPYSGAVNLTYNKITNNSIGIRVWGQPIINYNNIYENIPYNVYNGNPQGSPDVNATNNWWGTTDESTIQAHIYDWYDDSSLGIVDYIPYLMEPVLPTQPPIASFTYSPENPIVNQTITFNASGSYDPDGHIISYEWDFGDGNITSTTEEKIKHSYSEAGSYKVTLTVKDDKGATNSTAKVITVYSRAIFDTGSSRNPYPSIMGTHKGTIKPNHTVIATKLYTYACEGTGGHTEYARIWNKTWEANATWEGYTEDWHNITFDKTVVLLAGETYFYEIRTGSYPQIHHTDALLTANGWINCTEFKDTNGRVYHDWIPAIKLF